MSEAKYQAERSAFHSRAQIISVSVYRRVVTGRISAVLVNFIRVMDGTGELTQLDSEFHVVC